MAFGSVGRNYMGPLLIVNSVMYLIVLGIAGWSLDKTINGEYHPHLQGNPATSYLLIYSLLAGVIGVCSVFAGILHLRAWRNDSLAGVSSLALISWAITALAFGVACKQISIGYRGTRLRTLEAFIIILTFTQLVYVGLLHAGFVNSRFGPGYRNNGMEYGGMARETQKAASPTI
ncbi:membrane protein PM19L-like [Tasmannia lanceolata]|uniref:membrane protein PM19L-like n=1 Tax=Tasmannia lanceolata TaxID=3420 RepID=UPI0040646612